MNLKAWVRMSLPFPCGLNLKAHRASLVP
ncbi:hypothetical protein SGPA1_41200 [Streptomyces misionensis JCM 4497]